MRQDQAKLLAAALGFLSSFVLLAIAIGSDPYFHPTDLSAWVSDPERLAECWRTGNWFGCETISKFTLAYLLNAKILLALQRLGHPPAVVLQNINTLVVSLPVLVLISIAQSWRNGLKNASAFLLLIALSPIPAFYLRSAALEVQSGCFLGVAILLGLINSQQPSRRLLLLSNAFLLLACLYKDTIAPTFAITVALALFLAPAPKPSLSSLIWSWGPGLFGAIAFCVAWNVVRYNSFLPVAYQTEASLNRPSLSQALTSLTALIFSPNGGLVCFWGTTCAGVLLVLLFRKCLQSSTLVFPWLLLTTFVLLGIGTMALWWAPFGWDAWGARLSIPFVLASIVTALGLASRASDQPTQIIGKTVHFWTFLLAGLLVSYSLPYVLLGYTTSRDISYAKSMGGGCPGMFEEIASMRHGHPNILVRMWRSKSYWPCMERRMWINPAV